MVNAQNVQPLNVHKSMEKLNKNNFFSFLLTVTDKKIWNESDVEPPANFYVFFNPLPDYL